ncbi:universal stress protein [Chloroflexota bacterium]
MEYKKILIPVAGTEADAETIRLSGRLTKKDKGKVFSLYVITIKRSLPLDAEIDSETKLAETVLNNVEDIAAEEGMKIDTAIIQSRDAGPAIIEEAVERAVDCILIGIKYKTAFGQFSLGSVIPYVLKHAHCPVILYQK